MFIIIQHNKFVGEEWFQDKVNDWCSEYFTPLVVNKQNETATQ